MKLLLDLADSLSPQDAADAGMKLFTEIPWCRKVELITDSHDARAQQQREKNSLRDIESFCEGRIKLGVMEKAYKDVLFLVRQHIKLSERAEA